MILFILRRLGWSAVTIFGVMIITFVLFRGFAGDIAAAHLGAKAPESEKAQWRHTHGFDLPWIVNVHKRLEIVDNTFGGQPFMAAEPRGSGSNFVSALALIRELRDDKAKAPSPEEEQAAPEGEEGAAEGSTTQATAPASRPADWKTPMLVGRYVYDLTDSTPVAKLTEGAALIDKSTYRPPAPPASAPASGSAPAGEPLTASAPAAPAGPAAVAVFNLSDGTKLKIDFTGAQTAGDIIKRINDDPQNNGKLTAKITDFSGWSTGERAANFFHSQFFVHLKESITFQGQSLTDQRKLTDIIREKGPYSLAITVPAMAFEFMFGLTIACFVAYYRGTRVDKVGVFLSVLGMSIPFLAFMIYGQRLFFAFWPAHAFGIITSRLNVYLPVGIMVLASLGSMVRFYRTVILDETTRDYVRTARAKGLSLPTILFKHVLRNCMLPILTNLIMTIPFLFMGSLLVESFFGIPGLGDLFFTSIMNRNEPIMSGLVFLTALIYTLGVLLTDLSYALFDPRVRLG